MISEKIKEAETLARIAEPNAAFTTAQRSKIYTLAEHFNADPSKLSIFYGGMGLPDGWVSLGIPLGGDRWYAFGIAPNGDSHS